MDLEGISLLFKMMRRHALTLAGELGITSPYAQMRGLNALRDSRFNS